MAAQKDVQDLLRMLTSGRSKLPMMGAMARIKSLQEAGVRSIDEIANAEIAVLAKATGDEKAAKQLQTAARKESDPAKKRSATDSLSSPIAKRKKSAFEISNEPQTPQELEKSLVLPEPSTDEEEISQTTIYCNRAPLVLAFTVSLLKHTMPDQPLSSRLSLAQAVVSVNSRSKAVNLGITKGASAEEEGWGHGQPKVRIMGREICVLKRGGYEWKADDEHKTQGEVANVKVEPREAEPIADCDNSGEIFHPVEKNLKWAVSRPASSKGSTFVARSIGGVRSSSHARQLLRQLMSDVPDLRSATHNVTAWRFQTEQGRLIEESEDDGETGGGAHMLEILQSSNLVGVMIVMSRWYGGVLLYNQRWELMSQVCRGCLSERLRVAGSIGQEALWGLDLESMKAKDTPLVGGMGSGMPIYKPESARAYIMKAFASADDKSGDSPAKKKRTGIALEREKEHNLGLLLSALDLLFSSWVGNINGDDLDRRAWIWYCQVRPEVESGVAGWGGKGEVSLDKILELRRKD